MRVLLLGSSGQIGWELQRLLANGAEVTAPSSTEVNLARPKTLLGAIRSTRPDVILNAAAYTAVDAAEKDEAGAMRANAEGPRVLAGEAARQNAVLVHYSTDYVFDGVSRVPYREGDAPQPMSAYGRSKLAGEEAIRRSGCRHIILRTSWVYASRGKNFLLTILRLANERPELRVVADQIGAPTSARAIAKGTASLIDAVLRKGGAIEETLHMTCAGRASWHEFASRIVDRGAELGLCRKVPVRPITTAEYPLPAKRPAFSVLSNERLSSAWHISLPDWKAALDDCLAELAVR